MQRFKLLLLSLTVSLSGFGLLGLGAARALSLSAPTPVVADLKGDACSGLSQLNSNQGCSQAGGSGVTNLVKTIVEILSVVVGIASVIMIIIAGFKYITSAGDSNSIASAKNTLIYALVGLVIVAFAQFMVHFVVNTSSAAAH